MLTTMQYLLMITYQLDCYELPEIGEPATLLDERLIYKVML